MSTTTFEQDAVPVTILSAAPEDASLQVVRLPSVGRKRVEVLGGGVTGLTAAYELRRQLGERAAILLISEVAQKEVIVGDDSATTFRLSPMGGSDFFQTPWS